METDSLFPIYIFMLLFSIALVFFKIGSNYACENKNTKVEYRFIPRTQKELEENTQASDVLQDFV
jgi:hypothetical protein